jgi:glycosyltransferase involved in cell wall biosynthesis
MPEMCYPGTAARLTLVAEAYLHKCIGTYRKCVDCFLAPSQFVRDKFVEHGWDSAKFEVLPHFQRVKPAAENRTDDAPILYFGRLSREKGVEDLLRAMARLPKLRLTVAGEGPERSPLEQLSRELGLRNVEFVGSLRGNDLDRAIAGSRFTVLPSHAYETLGKTILESYAMGRAVVASDLGSRRELVRDGETGLLYKTGDVHELASVLQFLSSRPDLAERMGRAGQELVCRDYTPETHCETLINLYERLAFGKNAPSQSAEKRSLGTLGAKALTEKGGFIAALKRCATENRSFSVVRSAGRTISPRSDAVTIGWQQNAGSSEPNLIPLQIPVQRLARNRSPRDAATFMPPFPAKKKLRVAFIGGRGVISKYSGIETYYEEVGKRLAGMGHEVTMYCRTYFTPPVSEHNGMRVVRLPTIRSKHMETLLHTFLSTVHIMLRPCDVVHYHALGPALFSLIPRLAGKKTVVTVQGLDWQRKKWGRLASAVLRLGEKAAVCLPTETMVVSHVLQQHYRTGHGIDTFYVPNGGLLRDLEIPHKILEWDLYPGRYILFLGRLSPEKGCHTLVEAFESLQTDVKLVLAGPSSYCDDYSRQLRSHAGDHITMLDWVSGSALDELLTNAMLFVLPSDIEGLSLALLDAMGAGLCVVTSDVPENQEAVEGAGFTFRQGDAADLADRLQFLIANPAVREAAGQAAKRRVREQYQWPGIAQQVERVYFDMMGWDGTRSAAKKPSASVTTTAALAQRKAG